MSVMNALVVSIHIIDCWIGMKLPIPRGKSLTHAHSRECDEGNTLCLRTPAASFDSRTNETLRTTREGGLTDGHDFDSSTGFVADRRGAELATQQELGLLPFRTARSDPASDNHTGAHWTALEDRASLARTWAGS